jgi:imidazolonepropionase-like amidohydrolase
MSLNARRWLPAVFATARGRALIGTVWIGGAAEPAPGAVVIGSTGRIERVLSGSAADVRAELPQDLTVIGHDGAWVGPGIVDAHVHLMFGGLGDCLAAGVVSVRDLGAPADRAAGWQTSRRQVEQRPSRSRPSVTVCGPILTAPGGYPSQSWGAAAGVAAALASPHRAGLVVRQLAARGVDLIKVALEPGLANWPTPNRATLAAVVEAAHDEGLPVVAHALSARMVTRALDVGVDELAHTPTERLDDALIERLVSSGVGVISTLQTFFSEGVGSAAAANAAALVRAGGVLRYGTDLGNTGTTHGVDPRELDRLAQTGLGRLGALRAATQGAAEAAGMRGPTGFLRVGELAAAVVLAGDPIREPLLWRAPIAVVVGPDVIPGVGAGAAGVQERVRGLGRRLRLGAGARASGAPGEQRNLA